MQVAHKPYKAFKACFIARSDYGKSYLIADYLIKLMADKTVHPKRIILFSKTFKSDDS